MEEEPIERCPYCLNPIKFRTSQDLMVRMSPRQYSVYMAVTEAGPNGKSTKDLMDAFFVGLKLGTLRTTIFSINTKIAPMCLRSRGGRYYLDRVKWSEEPIKED